MINIENVSYRYDNSATSTLTNINLAISEGEYIALIGPNGSGKTTLIRQLNALLLPSSGTVSIDGLDTKEPRNLIEVRRRVGMVFQNPDNQIIGMTVEEDVAFGPGNLGLPSIEVQERVSNALATVGLNGFETRNPHTLSGGEKQLLALAGLLAMNSKYIILDEPTSSLDPNSRKVVLALLQKLKQQGLAIIHVTHSMDEAAIADRVLVINKGAIIADGSPGSILNQVDWLKSLGLAPPQFTELLWLLQQSGENVNTSIFDLNDTFSEITALITRLRTK